MSNFEEKVKEKIKIYSDEKYLDGYIKNEFLTEDGDADIYLKIKNKNDIFDERTYGNQLDLKKEIYEFVEEKTSMLDNDVQINLHIIGHKFNSTDEQMIKHIFREHYAIELYKKQREYKNNKIKIFTLFLTGLFTLLCYLLFYINTDLLIFVEVFGFIFSFALWEAFDLLIYDFSDVKYEREAITQNLLVEIDFTSEEKYQDD